MQLHPSRQLPRVPGRPPPLPPAPCPTKTCFRAPSPCSPGAADCTPRCCCVLSPRYFIEWNFLIYGLCKFPGCGIFLVVCIFLPP